MYTLLASTVFAGSKLKTRSEKVICYVSSNKVYHSTLSHYLVWNKIIALMKVYIESYDQASR